MTIYTILAIIIFIIIFISRFINVEIRVNTETIDDEKDKNTIRKLKRELDENDALRDYFKNNKCLQSIYYDLYPNDKESEFENKNINNKEVSR